MAIYVFYHIFCNSNTIEIIRSQLDRIVFSGLYDYVDKIYCFLTGDPHNVKHCFSVIESIGKKCVVADIGIGDTSGERYTLLRIHNYIKDDDKILYIHSKGVTKSPNNRPIQDWRTLMEYYLIRQYKQCIHDLSLYDVVGVNYSEYISNHFSGNFWWSTGAYFLKLPNVIGNEYCDPEFYICSKKPRIYNYHTCPVNQYTHQYPIILYIDE